MRVAENSGGTLYYLLTDHLGSTALTLDSAGNRLSTNTELRYYPWGATRYIAGATPTTFNFTGQRRDSGSGLLYYGARWYDPVIGRFISADTIVPQPGNPQSLNRYSYALNSPVRYADPTGMFSEDEIEAYLRAQYGDQWRSYWDAWYSDKVFWSMLLLADYDDVLYAPTTSLTSGTFVHAGNTFGFAGQHALFEYQGYGPYRLTNANGTVDKLSVQSHITAHPVDTDSTRYQTWEQPLYRYDDKGPHFSGYYRKVSYQWTGDILAPALDAGTGLPWLGTGFVSWVAPRVGLGACAWCLPASVLGFVNSAIPIPYSLQVDLVDKRTFLGVNEPFVNKDGMCYPLVPPKHESYDLWR